MPVAVVTDSTAYLPPELLRVHRLTVVPLAVVLNGAEGLEGWRPPLPTPPGCSAAGASR